MQNLIESKIQPEELARFRRLAADYFLTDFIPMMEPLLKRHIEITYGEPDDYSQVGNSRLGGLPDVPADFVWPRDSEGKYLHMVFQLNLADIASMQAILPASGVLQFFLGGEKYSDEKYDYQARYNVKILYHAPNIPLSRFELPPETDVEDYSWRFYGDPEWPWHEESGAEPLSDEPYQVHFHPTLSLPDDQSGFYQVEGYKNFQEYIDANLNISEEDSYKGDYFDMVLDLNVPPEFDEAPNNAHSLLGYVLWCSRAYDPQEMDQESDTGIPVGDLLFQTNPIHYDGFRHGWLGAMEGTFEYIVPRENLKNLDFSRVDIDNEG